MFKRNKMLFIVGAVMFLAGCSRPKAPEFIMETDKVSVQADLSIQQEGDKIMETSSDMSIELAMTVKEHKVLGTEAEDNIEKDEMQAEDKIEISSLSHNSDYTELKVKELAKEGEHPDREMGLSWERGRIQSVCYTDVQELCEEAFGDYLGPLQGLTEMFCGVADQYKTRFRTDKQTAIVSNGSVLFYLFLPNNIAEVSIIERDKTYYTEVKILSTESEVGIEVLELPPTGGIGIAGTGQEPEKQNYKTHSITTKIIENGYTKADIQLVFSDYIQRLTEEVFGDYVQALQGLYMLAEQEGYGGDFTIQDTSIYISLGYYETTVMEEDYCEFTMWLPYPDRARVTITRTGYNYITTFRLLKEGEFETEVQPGG